MDNTGWRMYSSGSAVPGRDHDREPIWGPAVVCSSISRDDFLRWLESGDDAPQRWQFDPKPYSSLGRVLVYSGSTLVHQCTASAIIESIRDQVTQIGEDPSLEDALLPPVSLICRFDSHLLAPDDALVPADAAKDSLPTLVVEIAYVNETLAMLQTRLARWLQSVNGRVQVAIGVKICSASPRRTLVVLQRGQAPQFAEVGGRARGFGWHAPSTTSTVATFPVGALFRGFALPRALRGLEREPILLDVDDLRAVVQQAQRAMKQRGTGGM